MITLTRYKESPSERCPVKLQVDPRRVEAVWLTRNIGGTGTYTFTSVHMYSGMTFRVRETPEEILETIEGLDLYR
jgi:hypothetical protein